MKKANEDRKTKTPESDCGIKNGNEKSFSGIIFASFLRAENN